MIETLRSLVTDSPFPSLHVMVIHFPIALLFIAPLFDIGCIVFRKRVWLDRAAATLYVMGTIGAGAAYLTGQRAAAALQDLSPATESALADHENLATLTLITLSVVCLVRLTVSWLARDDRRINLGIFRLVAIPVVLAGLVMLALTADRGGKLVYRYGVGVTPGIVETLER
jgi:uncharacterized membrane protein